MSESCSSMKLDLAHNRLASLPETFGGCTALLDLDISDNRLKQLPPGFESDVADLRQLKMSYNKFTAVCVCSVPSSASSYLPSCLD